MSGWLSCAARVCRRSEPPGVSVMINAAATNSTTTATTSITNANPVAKTAPPATCSIKSRRCTITPEGRASVAASVKKKSGGATLASTCSGGKIQGATRVPKTNSPRPRASTKRRANHQGPGSRATTERTPEYLRHPIQAMIAPAKPLTAKTLTATVLICSRSN